MRVATLTVTSDMSSYARTSMSYVIVMMKLQRRKQLHPLLGVDALEKSKRLTYSCFLVPVTKSSGKLHLFHIIAISSHHQLVSSGAILGWLTSMEDCHK